MAKWLNFGQARHATAADSINKDHKVGQKEWQCPSCKKTVDRDLNAARNILDWGIHPEHHAKLKKTAEEGKNLSPSSLVTEV
ncbi:zinc ribbon domain-containing protein [Lactobacillus delbrueckii]|uniref:zinc ribbon domain-containing protein n=1 Tax=Lactobacillus delbrueckii TaxID=1584 RepID=UPI0006811D56|nr:zinc ribbon domain-containing protein [Lactobacillus delbrueckii]KNE74783.1 hypothetical protein LDS38_01295 [Lactobacillus delbrueckii subsp. sunkii]